jgi:hypothetical protein
LLTTISKLPNFDAGKYLLSSKYVTDLIVVTYFENEFYSFCPIDNRSLEKNGRLGN